MKANSTKPFKKLLKSSDDIRPYREHSDFGRRLRRRVLDTIRRTQLCAEHSTLVLGLSGGPDSVTLFHLFLSLQTYLHLSLIVAHVNYRLRGKDADRDEAFVTALCQQYAIPLYIHRPSLKKSDEAALRSIRYAFFERIRKKHHATSIAIAHTSDDQAETFLLRLLRGSGPDGLQAMRFTHEHIIRPLLQTPRADILHYLKTEQLTFRTDQSNQSHQYARNRVRHLLIPYLEQHFQPNIRALLATNASLLQQALSQTNTPNDLTPLQSVSFSRKAFLAAPAPEQALFLRTMCRALSSTKQFPRYTFVQEALKLLSSHKSKVQTLTTRELKLEARGDKVVLIQQKSDLSLL